MGNLAIEALSAFSSRRLDLTIFPTEKCQFRCTYCYEDFAVGRMRRSTINGVKNLLRARAEDLSALSISWFGGEPLLAADIVEEIMKLTSELAGQHGFKVAGSMTTNGALLSLSTLERQVEHLVRNFQITLDGPKESHDCTRLRANGSGTFDQVYSNILTARDCSLPFEIIIRLHITPQNGGQIVGFTHQLMNDFVLVDDRFSILPMLVGDWGGPNTGRIEHLSGNVGDELLAEVRAIAWGPRGPAEGHEALDVCYAAKPNAFTIRADGSVGKCTVALTNPSNRIGTLASDGTISVDQRKARLWMSGWETMDESVLGCPLGSVIAKALAEANPL